MRLFFAGIFILLTISLWAQDRENPLAAILKSEDTLISKVMNHAEAHELQIIYTQIDRDTSGNAVFKTYRFPEDPKAYFYPASSVKLPIVIFAMEKFLGKKMGAQGVFDLDTPYKIEGDSITSTFRKDISEIFAVSDNAAYNRLFEFLGRDTINAMLRRIDLVPAQIVHRVGVTNSAAAKTRDIIVYTSAKDSVVLPGSVSAPISPLQLTGIQKGKAYMDEDSLVSGPMDFSEKNYFPLQTQQEVLKRLFFPQHYDADKTFALSEKNRAFLIETMQKPPRLSGYDSQKYYDSYGKFFIYGDKKTKIPKYMHIYNKEGDAYGTLTDNAYIKDDYSGVEFFLSATILVNKNEVFNDDMYEYDTVGIPFLAELGRRVYQFELAIHP